MSDPLAIVQSRLTSDSLHDAVDRWTVFREDRAIYEATSLEHLLTHVSPESQRQALRLLIQPYSMAEVRDRLGITDKAMSQRWLRLRNAVGLNAGHASGDRVALTLMAYGHIPCFCRGKDWRTDEG